MFWNTYVYRIRFKAFSRTAPFKEKRTSKKDYFFRKKGSSVVTFSVCLCVRLSAAWRPQIWPRALIFLHEGSLGEPLETYFFLFLDIMKFDLLVAFSRQFLSVFGLFCVCPWPAGQSFWPRKLSFGMKDS